MIHKEIEVDKAYTFSWKLYRNAIQITPTSATVTITNNSGGSVQTGSGTIGSGGTVTYELTAANNDTIDENYKALLSYVYNSATTTQAELFDVVKQPIVNLVTDTDLYVYLDDLRRKLYTFSGESDNTGNLNVIQDDALKSDDRTWAGGKVEIYISDTIVHSANVTAFDSTTGNISFSPAYSSTVASSVKYVIRDSYTPQITLAFDDHVHPTLRKKIKTTSGFLDSNVVKKLIVYKALENICFKNIEEDGDKWSLRYTRFQDEYNAELSRFNEAYDYDEDGNMSLGEEANKFAFTTRKVQR
jgi:hypothetical protein